MIDEGSKGQLSDIVEKITIRQGDAHELACLGYIAKLFCQIKQTDFVFDDSFVSMKHEGYLFGFDGWVAPPPKPVTLTFSSGVRFGLNYYI